MAVLPRQLGRKRRGKFLRCRYLCNSLSALAVSRLVRFENLACYWAKFGVLDGRHYGPQLRIPLQLEKR